MSRTHALQGIGCSLALTLLLCFPTTEAESGMDVEGPKVASVELKYGGTRLKRLICVVTVESLQSETLVYWLVNDTFVEIAYKDGRVRTKEAWHGSKFQTSLLFKEVLPEDLYNTFTCTALNPAGWDQKSMQIPMNSIGTHTFLKRSRSQKVTET